LLELAAVELKIVTAVMVVVTDETAWFPLRKLPK